MMKDLQLPPIEKPFSQNYLGEFSKFKCIMKERKPIRLPMFDSLIVLNAYSPYMGFPHVRFNKLQRAAKVLLKAIFERQIEEMRNET
ncbi:hypothetical protein KA005_53465 [bacterium]|nr:hypothetical protein [bacterium]